MKEVLKLIREVLTKDGKNLSEESKKNLEKAINLLKRDFSQIRNEEEDYWYRITSSKW
ncbi:MAG: hypothetical protein NZM44_04495 [Candidatus Calescibacterium sp.]|nr:hypothetical protein [Candidatus Calescibacterium sp.]